MLEDHSFRDLVRKGTAQEKKSLQLRPKTLPAEYREAWMSAVRYCKISRDNWREQTKNPTHKGWPPWMTFPDFIDRRLQEHFGPIKMWDHQLKKRLWREFPEFRMTDKEWRPKNAKT